MPGEGDANAFVEEPGPALDARSCERREDGESADGIRTHLAESDRPAPSLLGMHA